MKFDFRRASTPPVAARADLSDSSLTYLLYSAFMGDLEIVSADISIKTGFGWVPLLNLVLELPRAVRDAATTGVGVYEFTESDSRLTFTRELEGFAIRGSYSPGEIRVSGEELQQAISKFTEASLAYVVSSNPELSLNHEFASTFLKSR